MPELKPLVEEEGERPEVEVVDCLLGHHVKVCSTTSFLVLSVHGLHHFEWILSPQRTICSTALATPFTISFVNVRQLMLQIVTTEKRTFNGTLMCVDHFGNLLLYDAVEEMNTSTKAHKRILNQVIISLEKLQAVSVLVWF